MRFLISLWFTIVTALAQTPAIPLYLEIPTPPLGGEGIKAASLPEAEIRSLVEPRLIQAGFRLVPEAEAVAAPGGRMMMIHAVEMEGREGIKGFDVLVVLGSPAKLKGGTPDPQAKGVSSTVFAKADRMSARRIRTKVEELVELVIHPGLTQTPSGKAAGGPLLVASKAKEEPGDGAKEIRILDLKFENIRVKTQPPVPRYPTLARNRRVQGEVVVEIVINAEGLPEEAVIRQGPRELRAYAAAFAMGWRFHPAAMNGIPMWAKFTLRMPFKLA